MKSLLRIRKGQPYHSLDSSWPGGWRGSNSAKDLKIVLQTNLYHCNGTRSLQLIYYLCCFYYLPDKKNVPAFFCSLKINMFIKTCLYNYKCKKTHWVIKKKKKRTVQGQVLWPGLGQKMTWAKMASLMSRKPCLVLFFQGSPIPICLYYLLLRDKICYYYETVF